MDLFQVLGSGVKMPRPVQWAEAAQKRIQQFARTWKKVAAVPWSNSPR
jgi:hypothetical protein